jgi:hypothetical protein
VSSLWHWHGGTGSQKKLAELPEVSSAIRDVKNIAKSTSEE